jgi:hypothetical protein
MNGQDEIIEMAKLAGLSVENPQFGYFERHHIAGWITNLEDFAKLVAAKEREACAIDCETNGRDLAGLYYAGVIRART